uniref:Movement protein TGB2 n=1 Tax=Cowpea mild mottle virus TaxID=67761 RepID=A0A411EZR8_9VIRU|nr:triple gene block protein 2 [Cowpea mild mottle virus]
MPLTPPPNHSNSYLAAAIGVGISLIVLAFNRYVYPVGGDSQHKFPFGGCYRDGTKAAIYNRPSLPRSAGTSFNKLEIFLGILTLSFLIIYLSSRKSRVCYVCNRIH